mgnify:FL=1
MKNIAEKIRKYAKPYMLLILLIAVQLIYTSFCFVTKKQGCHSDEIWSYGLANSYYQPFIYMKDGVFIDDMTVDDVINYNEWESGEVFKDYITVQPGERFAYGSVYHNQTLDHHPPLYYMLLHTVCSFFPNSFSLYYSFFLNCIFLIVTQVFLYKLSKLILKSEYAALLPCILYGAGTGALATFVFLRQYSLLTALGVMYTYFSAKLYLSENFDLKKHLAPVLITSFLMFMTHYNGIAYVGIFTACMCIYLLCKKKIKKLFIYGGSQLATLGLFFAVYPAGWKQIMGSGCYGEKAFSFSEQMRVFLNYVSKYNLGFFVSLYKSSAYSYVIAIIILFFGLMIPLSFLFRKEPWFIELRSRFISTIKTCFTKTREWIKKADFIPVFIFISSIAVIIAANKTVDIIEMKVYSMRYIFMTFPLFVVTAVSLVYFIIKKIPRINKNSFIFTLAIVICAVIRVNSISECEFYFQSSNGKCDIANLVSNKNCLVVSNIDEKQVWRITHFTRYIYDAKNVFHTSSAVLSSNMQKINSLDEKVDYIFIISTSCDIPEEKKNEYLKSLSNQNYNKNNSEENDNSSIVVDKDVSEKIESKYINCTQDVEELLGNDYRIVCTMNINGGEYFLLEHE